MSTMHVAICTTMGAGAPVYSPSVRAAQAVTTSGTSATSTIKATSGDYARVTAVDAALYVAVNKTATASVGYYVPVGGVIDLGPLKDEDTITGIEA